MVGKPSGIYLLDCDELTNLFQREDLGKIWSGFVELVKKGNVKSVDQVFCELEKFPEVIKKYKPLKQQLKVPAIQQYDESVTAFMSKIEQASPKLINFMGRTGPCDPADPWLIAVGAAKGWTVVTHEKRSGSGVKRSIYTVCKDLGVRCVNLQDFLKETGLSKS